MFKERTIFYIGVVEDINDPDKLGRVRVRIVGLHTDNKADIPTSSLPWSPVLMSNMSASITGIGISPHGLVNGSWVLISFLDTSKQKPIILGSLLGQHSVSSNSNIGFNDPNGIYPLADRLNKPDVNQLATNKYPHNKVLETTSGHIIEIDDTPNDNRIHIKHSSGAIILIDNDGNVKIESPSNISVTGKRVDIN